MDLDCLQCDRCRSVTEREKQRLQAQSAPPARGTTVLFVVALLSAALLLARHANEVQGRVSMQGIRGPAVAGESRAADVRQLKHLIEQGVLSDHEALYYHEHHGDARAPAP